MGSEITPPLEDLENKFQALVSRHPVAIGVLITCAVITAIGIGILLIQGLG